MINFGAKNRIRDERMSFLSFKKRKRRRTIRSRLRCIAGKTGTHKDYRRLTDIFPVRSRRVRRPCTSVALPIVDAHREIVGWTDVAPEVRGAQLSHPQAERLVGEIDACVIEIDDSVTAARAGAPLGWSGPWRCIAVCSAEITKLKVPERLIVRVQTANHLSGQGSNRPQ